MSAKSKDSAPQPKDQLKPLMSGMVGMLAAVGTNFVLYPLDLVKVRLQGTKLLAHRIHKPGFAAFLCTAILPFVLFLLLNFMLLLFNLAAAYKDILKLSRFRAIREVVTTTWAEGGARGFYVGLAPGLFGPTVAWGSYMVAYASKFKTHFLSHFGLNSSLVSSFYSVATVASLSLTTQLSEFSKLFITIKQFSYGLSSPRILFSRRYVLLTPLM